MVYLRFQAFDLSITTSNHWKGGLKRYGGTRLVVEHETLMFSVVGFQVVLIEQDSRYEWGIENANMNGTPFFLFVVSPRGFHDLYYSHTALVY